MKPLGVVVAMMCSCATVSSLPDEPEATLAPVEVSGRVLSACGPEPLSREPVAVRVPGELEVLDSTETDAQGVFTLRVNAPTSPQQSLFIEARGSRAVARPSADVTKRGLVAELVLPCRGG